MLKGVATFRIGSAYPVARQGVHVTIIATIFLISKIPVLIYMYIDTYVSKDCMSLGHCVALSLSDLSVWCYECSKYVKCTMLEPLLEVASWYKHHDKTDHVPVSPQLVNRTAVSFDGKRTSRHRPNSSQKGVFALENPDRVQTAIDTLSERNILSMYGVCSVVV